MYARIRKARLIAVESFYLAELGAALLPLFTHCREGKFSETLTEKRARGLTLSLLCKASSGLWHFSRKKGILAIERRVSEWGGFGWGGHRGSRFWGLKRRLGGVQSLMMPMVSGSETQPEVLYNASSADSYDYSKDEDYHAAT